MKFIFVLSAFISSVASASTHPWDDLKGCYRTVSIDGVTIEQDESPLTLTKFIPGQHWFVIDADYKLMPTLNILIFTGKSENGQPEHHFEGAITNATYSQKGKKRFYKFVGKVRDVRKPEAGTLSLDNQITIDLADPLNLTMKIKRFIPENNLSLEMSAVLKPTSCQLN